ncbi:unnamed protein product [Paramecium pentaurelia]|uniref:Uncharacterized protein n=1 Tax=Paramecium pentaurelia TaxID=43138 RepID=A0A8S1RVQ9_9CILI|nr:unnamed protein product [Paramecium pentaurelia]
MNQTTPKSSGINYARKQKSKESTISKTLNKNLQFDNQQNNQY